MMMKALVITEGGKGIGFGHLVRCLSICEEFTRQGVDNIFVVNQDKVLAEKLRDRKINFHTYKNKKELIDIVNSLNADILLIDSYLLDQKTYSAIANKKRLSIAIDDYNRMKYPTDMIINSSINAESLNYDNNHGKSFLLGPRYYPIRNGFLKKKERPIRQNIEKVFVAFGGDDSKSMTPEIIRLLLKNSKGTKIEALIGASARDRNYLKEFSREKRVHFNFDLKPKEVSSLMSDTDIAISAGGQTLYELALTGTPTIGICISENQMLNLKGWEDAGFIKFSGWYSDPKIEKSVRTHILELSDKKARRDSSKNGISHIDSRGAERIVMEILKKLSDKRNRS